MVPVPTDPLPKDDGCHLPDRVGLSTTGLEDINKSGNAARILEQWL